MMGLTIALSVSGLCGGLLLFLAATAVAVFPRVPAARSWVLSWSLAGLGCLFVSFSPLAPVFSTGPLELFLRTFFVLSSQLALGLGYLSWFGISPSQGKGALTRTILWGGTALALFPVALGLTERDPVAWALVAAWSLVPAGLSVFYLVLHGLRDAHPAFQAQSASLLKSLVFGAAPYLLSWIVLPLFSETGWVLGFVPFLVLGAAMTLRSLSHFDTRFHSQYSAPFLVEKTQDPVVFLQADGRIQAINPAFLSMVDREEGGLTGLLPSELAADDESRHLLEPLESLVFPDWEGALALAQRSGRPVPVHVVYRRVHNPAREAVGAVLLFHDLRRPHRLDLSTREDSLTALSNRRWVFELLAAEFLRAKRYGGSLAVLWIEVDHWADLRARTGQPGTVEVLRRVAAILRGGLRKTDFCGRVGSNEFLVVLPETALDRAGVVAHRLDRMYALADDGASGTGLKMGTAMLDDSITTTHELVARAKGSIPGGSH